MNEQTGKDGLEQALRGLREDSASLAAPDHLQGALVEAFRAHHSARSRKQGWTWAAAAIAACLVLALGFRIFRPVNPTAPVVVAAPVHPSPEPAPVKRVEPLQLANTAKGKSPVRRRVRPAVQRPAPRLSVAEATPKRDQQEFVKIPYAPPFTSYDEGQVVRVNMAGSSARRMGVPVLLDRVQADLVVGNDGVPRAIRVVSNSESQF
jgi:hypothetical protein